MIVALTRPVFYSKGTGSDSKMAKISEEKLKETLEKVKLWKEKKEEWNKR